MAGKIHFSRTDAVGLAITLVLAAGLFYWAIGNSIAQVASLHNEQVELTERMGYITDLMATLHQGEASLQAVEARIEDLREQLPSKMNFQGFYEMLSERALENNVLIEITPQAITVSGELAEMPVSISAIASFDDFHRFLFALDNEPRLIKLQSLNVYPAESPNFCRIDMVAYIYSTRKE